MKHHITYIASIVLVTSAPLAVASSWGEVRQQPNKAIPVIEVFSSDGTHWDTVANEGSSTAYYLQVRGQCAEKMHLDELELSVQKFPGPVIATVDLPANSEHRSYGADHGQQWVDHKLTGTYQAPQAPAKAPAQICNDYLQQSTQGSSDPAAARFALLQSGFERRVVNAYTARFHMVCLANSNVGFHEPAFAGAEAPVDAKVVCRGVPKPPKPPKPATRTPVQPGITGMRLFDNPTGSANFVGFCPKNLHVGTEMIYKLAANAPAQVKYRYVATAGAKVIKSDTFTTQFAASGEKYLHAWTLPFPLASSGPTFTGATPDNEPTTVTGSIVLEFDDNPPIHANLKALPFSVKCLTKGTVIAPVANTDSLAVAEKPRDPIYLPKPDLVITGASVLKGDDRRVIVRLSNKGPASGAFKVRLIAPGKAAIDMQVQPMLANQTRQVGIHTSWDLSSVVSVELRADAANQVAEQNEENNAFVLRTGSLSLKQK
ncbi:MAG: CARDB domain-containing protein [Pseudomonadota bacterium]